MANYNPNSIWTSRQKQYDSSPASRAAEEGIAGVSPRGDDGKGNGILWFFAVFAVLVAVGVVYFVFLRTPNVNVGITFAKPDQVSIGDPFVLSVSLSNDSETVIKNGALELILPDGFSFADQSSDQQAISTSTDDMVPGAITTKDFTLVATGNPNSIGHITAKFLYGTAATGKTQFERDGSTDVLTGLSAVGLTFTIPQDVFSGQQFNVAVNYHNNTSHDISDVALTIQYPAGFVFATSSAPLKSGTNDVWDVGTIAAGAGGTIGITGIINGQANAVPLSFTGTLTTTPSGTGYVLDTETAPVTVATSPLLLSVTLNNTNTGAYVAGTDDSLAYVLSYVNNDAITLQDVVIKATLTGAMYDFSSLRSDGSFDSVTDTVTWSRATNPELASLAPGQSGSVKIRITTQKAFPIKSVNDKNYVLAVQAQIQSPTIPPNTSASSTIETADIQNKVGGAIVVTAAGYRKDASGIANAGPYPPVVNQPSQYTIHWNVINYSTDVKNIVVSAYLQSGSVFTGRVKSNISTQPTYDAATGIVTWVIPSLPATTGVISVPAEAVFQVENTPAVNQVNQMVTLLGATSLSADDTFTNETLNASADPVTTQLPHDPTVARESGIVVQ